MKYLLILISLISSPAFGLEVPAFTHRQVSDFAGVLSTTEKDNITDRLKTLEATQNVKALVVLIPTLFGDTIENFSNNLARAWKVGTKENNGVVLVLAMKEHKIRIEVGYGLESKLTDARSNQLIARNLKPLLKNGQVAGAVLSYIDGLAVFLDPNTTKKTQSSDSSIALWSMLIGAVLFGIFYLVFVLNVQTNEEEPIGITKETLADIRKKMHPYQTISPALKSSSGTDYIPVPIPYTSSGSDYSSSSGYSSSSDYSSSSSSSDWSSGGGGDFGGGGSSDSW